MTNNNLKTLAEVFNEKLFRIPDYQRGYSWGTQQLEDLWRDIDYLQLNKSHYTGMITVNEQERNKYMVIDGQQRITSLIIFIKNILEEYNHISEDGEIWITETLQKKSAVEKYLHFKMRGCKNSKMVFAPQEENSSYFFYKTKILGLPDKVNSHQEMTLYTKNLKNADNFFKEKLRGRAQVDLEKLFYKITNQLKFNWYEIEKTDDLDEYVTFETMNNRGKPLSVLEILKNRLIYITTLYDMDKNDKKKIRDDINIVWKKIFEILGKDTIITEDTFLIHHSMMYFGDHSNISVRELLLNDIFNVQKIYKYYEKISEYGQILENLNLIKENFRELKKISFSQAKKNRKLFEKIFNDSRNINLLFSQREPIICGEFYEWDLDAEGDSEWKEAFEDNLSNMLSDKKFYEDGLNVLYQEIIDVECTLKLQFIQYNFIDDYISSLKLSIINYYNILNLEFNSKETNFWLNKINMINDESLMSLLLSILNNIDNIQDSQLVKMLKIIEKFLFIKNYTSQRVNSVLQNTLRIGYEFNRYKVFHERYYSIPQSGVNTYKHIFNSKKFTNDIINLFYYENKEGWYSWRGIRYVLYEYELHLKNKFKNSDSKIPDWEEINKESIEHILPQNPEKWEDFKELDETEMKNYIHSLGNLLLLSKNRNSTVSNKLFQEKKDAFRRGSYSEIEVSENNKWTTEEIEERSKKILDFMNNRWGLKLNSNNIKKLLKAGL